MRIHSLFCSTNALAGASRLARRSLVSFAVVVMASACAGSSHEPQVDSDAVRARQVVVSLFASLEARDCGGIAVALGETLRSKMQRTSCDQFLAREPLVQAGRMAIGEARRDGRDGRAFMVTVSLDNDAEPRPVIVRVAPEDGAYRVVSM